MAAEGESLKKRAEGKIGATAFWQVSCVSAIAEHEVPDTRFQVGSVAPPSALAKGMPDGI